MLLNVCETFFSLEQSAIMEFMRLKHSDIL